MKTKSIILPVIILGLILVYISSCSTYSPKTYPFMDWSNPDSILSSYDTLSKSSKENQVYLCQFWIDPSATVKHYIEIFYIDGGYKIIKHKFGYAYNIRNESKLIDITTSINSEKNINEIVAKIDFLNFMNFNSRYHNWETDGGPMHTPMIWYRIKYHKNGQSNDFVFWKFSGEDLSDDMIKFIPIIDLIEKDILNLKN